MFSGCKSDPSPQTTATKYLKLQGETMGTYYGLNYADSLGRNFQPEIEQLLEAINLGVSTYIDVSVISKFNQASEGFALDDTTSGPARYFLDNYYASGAIFRQSSGAFDPTVMPLVNYWGFGYTPKRAVLAVDSAKVDSLLQFVGYEKVALKGNMMHKSAAGVQLDFSGCAKGYAVDKMAELLESKGVQHYLVNIGGDMRAKGLNAKGQYWNVGINRPEEDVELKNVEIALPLANRAVSTSGNYRNFYEVKGVKYSHTINPRAGFPERSTLLSASVFAPNSVTADACATACMVLGKERALEFIRSMPGLDAYLIVGKPDGSMDAVFTDGLKDELEGK